MPTLSILRREYPQQYKTCSTVDIMRKQSFPGIQMKLIELTAN